MEGSLEMSGWNSSEVYKVTQRYKSAHVFQPYQALKQEYGGSIRVPKFFQPPCRHHIPPSPSLIMDICASILKRKATEEIGDEDVQSIAPLAPGKTCVATSIKPWKKNIKDVEKDEEFG